MADRVCDPDAGSMRERMLTGEPYLAGGPELVELCRRALELPLEGAVGSDIRHRLR
jgi:hypothetical protein